MSREYDKLVRDRIPDIVRANDGVPTTRTVSDAEYRQYLHAKLDEEVTEVHKDPSAEELADVLAVLRALADAHDAPFEVVDRRCTEKADERGAFEDGIVLEAVDPADED